MTSSIPPAAKEMFESLCGDASAGELAELREEVRAHGEAIVEAAQHNELLPADIAQALTDSLQRLLKETPELAAEQRGLVVGAARYFVSEHDHIKDTSGILGLDDDVAVFNHVAREIGRVDLLLDM